MSYPALDQEIELYLTAIIYNADGISIQEFSYATKISAGWTSSLHSVGYGFCEPGNWVAGTYLVEIIKNNTVVASGGLKSYWTKLVYTEA